MTAESLIVTGPSGVRRWPWSVEQGELRVGAATDVAPPAGDTFSAVSRDRRRLALILPKSLQVLDLAGGSPPRTLPLPEHARFAALSADGRWFAAGMWHRPGVTVIDFDTGAVAAELDVPGDGARPSFSPDSKWLVTGNHLEYRFWKTGTWKQDRAAPRSRVSLPGYLA